jgi:nitrate reductase NapE component
MALKSFRGLLGFALRSASLGGRFVFTIFAAMWMSPMDFGVYGIVTAASAIIVQCVGLEAYQVTLRRVSRAGEEERPLPDRAHYGRFVALAALLAALSGAAFAAWFGWSLRLVALTAGVCLAEYVGTEATRILVAERRPDAAMFSISLRYLPWNLGLPLLALLGLVPRHWSAEAILLSWFLCSTAGCLFLVQVAHAYAVRTESGFAPWLKVLSREVPRWMLIGLSWRFLETGIRIVPGVLIDEKAGGHFVFFATIASIGSTGLKAAIEPFWFVRMIGAAEGAKARREYALITLLWLLLAMILSVAIVYGSARFGGRAVTHADIGAFALLLLAYGALALSQIPHFALYAADADRAIERVSLLALLAGLAVCIWGTLALGLIGAAAGSLVGSLVLLLGKGVAALGLGEGGRMPRPSAA